jgi:uncharacterized protein (TIGR02271 family)
MVERFRGRVSEGMVVKSAEGEKLGKVVACQPAGFVVEKGFLFPKDTMVPYERITSIGNGEILVSLARADLGEGAPVRTAAATARAAAGSVAEDVKEAALRAKDALTGASAEARGEARGETVSFEQFGKAGEICVALVEEELVTSKHVEKVGEVHVRKEVITEEKQITVPVTREVIRVERVMVSHDVEAGTRTFEKESYDIPIREEHITVEKHPVVREELHVGKEILLAEETASATVRRERAEVETLGPVRRAEARPGGDGAPHRAPNAVDLRR